MKMTKQKYHCCKCNQSAVLHEVFFGNGIKPLAVQYLLQVPLCQYHHTKAHENKELYQVIFCDMLNIGVKPTNRALNKHKGSDVSKRYLGILQRRLMPFLLKYEVD